MRASRPVPPLKREGRTLPGAVAFSRPFRPAQQQRPVVFSRVAVEIDPFSAREGTGFAFGKTRVR
jgi:hypothetical protein